jgi:hypothetical protein
MFHSLYNMKQDRLSIGDVAMALAMASEPAVSLKRLAELTCRSLGEVHNAERRLRAARLLRPDSRAVEREPLLRFIQWGVPHAYPATIGGMAVGIATAQLSASANGEPAESEFVWPAADGATRGQALAPPYPRAPQLVAVNPRLRQLLSLVDLVRVGGARDQAAAIAEIDRIAFPAAP